MSFNDLQLKVAEQAGIQAAHRNLAKISLFARSFSELNGTYGQAVAVPVYNLSAASDFVAGTNDYGSGSNEVGGELVALDSHIVKSVSISDRQLAETGISWVRDTTTALADTITRGINARVFGMINATNCPLSTDVNLTSKAVIAQLYAVAEENDIPVDNAVVALSPTKFASVLGQLDANIYGSDEAIKLGLIPGLYGFAGFVCTSNLPSGTNGAIITRDAIGVASRYLAPATEGAYPVAFAATDEDGFTLGFRRFMDLNTGLDKFACDALFGCKVILPSKIVRIVG